MPAAIKKQEKVRSANDQTKTRRERMLNPRAKGQSPNPGLSKNGEWSPRRPEGIEGITREKFGQKRTCKQDGDEGGKGSRAAELSLVRREQEKQLRKEKMSTGVQPGEGVFRLRTP